MDPRLTWRRLCAHAGILVAFGVTSAVYAVLLAALATSTADQLDRDVARALGDAPARDAALRVTATTRLQDEVAAAERVVARAREAGLVVTPSTRADGIDAGSAPYVVADYPDLARLASLASGRWGSADGEATVSAPAAGALGLAVGDTLDLGTATVEVVGTWTADDPADPRWFADPAVASGADTGAAGPVVVSAATLERLPDFRTSTWTVTVPASAGLDDLDALSTALPAVVADAEAGRVSTDGGLAEQVRDVARAASSVSAVGLVALVLVGVVGALVLWHVAGALRAARREEAMILAARGASRARLLAWHGGDAAAVGAAGAVAGLAVCAAVLGPPAPYVVALAVAVPAVLGIVRAWPPAAVRPRSLAPSTAPVAGALLALAGVLVTARAAWLGDVVTVSASGAVEVDALTVLAPALLLICAAALAALLMRPLLGGAARVAARASSGLSVVLALRQAGRRTGATTATLTLVALAVGTAIAAAVASTSAIALVDQTQASRAGDDVRISLDVAPLVDGQNPQVDPDRFADLPGVQRVRAAVEARAGVADLQTTLLAVDGGDGDSGVAAGRVPVALTAGLAGDLDVSTGDEIDVLVPDATATFPAVVRRVSRSLSGLPGAEGMVADRAAVLASLSKPDVDLTVNTLLVSSTDPEATAEAAPSVSDRPATAVRAGTPQGAVSAGAATTAWRWAGLGVALLGSLGIAAVVLGSVRASRRESAVLGALGASPSVRRRARLGESAVAVAAGAVAGAVGAAGVTFLLVPPLSRALTGDDAPDVGRVLTVDAPDLVVSLGLLVVAALLVGVASGRLLRAQTGSALREEDR